MTDRVDPDVELAALKDRVVLLEAWVADATAELDRTASKLSAATGELLASNTELSKLRLELARSPRHEEHARQLREELDRQHARLAAVAADRTVAALNRIPGGRTLARTAARLMGRRW